MNLWYLIFLIAKAVVSFGGATSGCLQADEDLLTEKETGIGSSIPFIQDNRTISFKALINEQYEGEFIYDTGLTTYYNLLSDTFCEKELASSAAFSKSKMFGAGVARWVDVAKEKVGIRVGELKVEGYYGIQKLSESDRKRYDGVLNVHIFKDSIVEFDFNRKLVIFHHQFNSIGYQKIKIIQRGFVRMVDVKASLENGFGISGRFLLDTGYWGLLELYCSRRTIDSLSSIYKVSKIHGTSNFDKNIDCYRMECGKASIGSATLLNPTMVLSHTLLPQEAKGQLQGLVGLEFFKMLVNPIVDFKSNVIYFKGRPIVKNKNMYEMGMHLFITKGGVMVKHVVENSEAYRKGLRPNDEVQAVNNVGVDNLSERGLNDLLDSLYSIKVPVELEYFRGGKRMKSILFYR